MDRAGTAARAGLRRPHGRQHPPAARGRDRARLPLAVDLGVRAADEDHARRRAAVVRVPARVASLAIALGATAAIAAGSFVIDPRPVVRVGRRPAGCREADPTGRSSSRSPSGSGCPLPLRSCSGARARTGAGRSRSHRASRFRSCASTASRCSSRCCRSSTGPRPRRPPAVGSGGRSWRARAPPPDRPGASLGTDGPPRQWPYPVRPVRRFTAPIDRVLARLPEPVEARIRDRLGLDLFVVVAAVLVVLRLFDSNPWTPWSSTCTPTGPPRRVHLQPGRSVHDRGVPLRAGLRAAPVADHGASLAVVRRAVDRGDRRDVHLARRGGGRSRSCSPAPLRSSCTSARSTSSSPRPWSSASATRWSGRSRC